MHWRRKSSCGQWKLSQCTFKKLPSRTSST